MTASIIKSFSIRSSTFIHTHASNISKNKKNYLITGIVLIALGFLAASLNIDFGSLSKWIKASPKKVEPVVPTIIPETEEMVGKSVGKATVLDKQKLAHDVTITEESLCSDESKFNAYIKENGKLEKIGYIHLVWFRQMQNREYGSENKGQLSTCYDPTIYYGSVKLQEGKNLSKICIHNMESLSKDKYQGIGTLLYQVAIEHGNKLGCEGRLILEASWNSHGFHYKLGARSRYPYQNRKIEEELEQAKEQGREPRELGNIWMYMPQEAIKKWKKK